MITYPLSPPAGLGPAHVKLIQVDAVGEVISPFDGSAQEQQWQDQHWEMEVALPPMIRRSALAGQWLAFLGALHGKFGTFTMGDPLGTGPLGSGKGNPVASAAPARSNIISSAGWLPSQSGLLLPGDYLQPQVTGGALPRLYQVMTPVNSDGGGNAAIDIFPSIREAIAASTPLILINPAGTWRLAQNRRDWDTAANKTVAISFKAREAI